MKNAPLLKVTDLQISLAGITVLKGVNFEINNGQCVAITGAAGSGKSTLLRAIAGKLAYQGSIVFPVSHLRCALIGQQHHFKNLSNTNTFYYQQRFNSADATDALTVNDELLKITPDQRTIDVQLEQLGIAHVKDAHLIKLSNGEHKRFQLARALLQRPQWLLLDSPYTGLDANARVLLDQILANLVEKGIHIILATNAATLPSCITHVAALSDGCCNGIIARDEFQSRNSGPLHSARLAPVLDVASFATCTEDFSVAIKMVNTNVRYDEREILNNINWEVKRGERWSISGHNGSGKSTLLSLVNGDNPQAFANAIWLFDRKKGSGESIWDIKKKIGFVSPELHHYFDPALLCWQVVASGLFDTIGLFRKPDAKQLASVDNWLSMLALEPYRNRYFNQLSNGEQRLVLLARALVKNPPLLILDEPCQGLDAEAAARFIALVDQICIELNKTLVYVTHYEAEVPSCVTRKLKLENGSIAA